MGLYSLICFNSDEYATYTEVGLDTLNPLSALADITHRCAPPASLGGSDSSNASMPMDFGEYRQIK